MAVRTHRQDWPNEIEFEDLDIHGRIGQYIRNQRNLLREQVAKPGASVSKAQAGDEQAKALRQQLKKTGRLEDAAKLFERFS